MHPFVSGTNVDNNRSQCTDIYDWLHFYVTRLYRTTSCSETMRGVGNVGWPINMHRACASLWPRECIKHSVSRARVRIDMFSTHSTFAFFFVLAY